VRVLNNNKREKAYSYKKEEEEGDSDLFRTKNPDQKKGNEGKKKTVFVSFFDNQRKRGHKKPISFSPKEFLF
jgi:hypothetical protein